MVITTDRVQPATGGQGWEPVRVAKCYFANPRSLATVVWKSCSARVAPSSRIAAANCCAMEPMGLSRLTDVPLLVAFDEMVLPCRFLCSLKGV